MTIVSFEEFSKGGKVTPLETKNNSSKTNNNSGSVIKDLGIGFAKGVGDTIQSTQNLGQRVLATVDPTKTYEQIRQTSGIKSLTNADFTASNNNQKVGKAIEFFAELAYPAGKIDAVADATMKSKKIVGASFDGIGSRLSELGDDVVEGGIKVKDKIGDMLVNLDQKTKTALDRTPKEVFQSFVEKGKAALSDDRIRTPLESVGDEIIDGLKQLKDRASSIGEAKSAFLNQAKIGLKRTGTIVRDALLETKKTFNSLKLDASDKKAVQTFFDELKKISNNPTLKEVDQTIDLLQDSLYKAGRSNAVEITDRITGPLRQILTNLNKKAGEIGGDAYKNYNKQYSELMEVVQELNAKVGKEGGGAGSFVKRLFSPSDARTKELFESLQKLTGKDFSRDARLAKYVMEVLGDVRSNSLLEIPTTARGLTEKAFDFVIDKIKDPIGTAERYIQNKGK